MAESDIFVFIIAGIVGLYFTVLLSILRTRRIRTTRKRTIPEFISRYPPREKRQFLISISVGVILGVLVYLPHFITITGGETDWVVPFIQLYPVIIYATLIVTFAVFKFIAVFLHVNFFTNHQGYVDGALSSFVIIQIIVFVNYPLIFFPTLNP